MISLTTDTFFVHVITIHVELEKSNAFLEGEEFMEFGEGFADAFFQFH